MKASLVGYAQILCQRFNDLRITEIMVCIIRLCYLRIVSHIGKLHFDINKKDISESIAKKFYFILVLTQIQNIH